MFTLKRTVPILEVKVLKKLKSLGLKFYTKLIILTQIPQAASLL
jgi:hypothetical protein